MAETYKGHRLGSRKATVRRTYDEDGFDAAVAKAKELGLAESTARSWVGLWKKVSNPPATMKPKDGTKYPEAKLGKVGNPTRRAVHLKGHPDWKGVVIETGPEQCIVRWANGNQVVACNHWLEDDKVETPLS